MRRMCPVGWKTDAEDFVGWRRRHSNIIEEQMEAAGLEDIVQACLCTKFRWTLNALKKFASDLVSRSWPDESTWQRIFSHIRGGTLPPTCRPNRAVQVAAICLVTESDAEGWKIKLLFS